MCNLTVLLETIQREFRKKRFCVQRALMSSARNALVRDFLLHVRVAWLCLNRIRK